MMGTFSNTIEGWLSGREILICAGIGRPVGLHCIQNKTGAAAMLLCGNGRLSPLLWVMWQQPKWVYSDLCRGGTALRRCEQPEAVPCCPGNDAWLWHNCQIPLPAHLPKVSHNTSHLPPPNAFSIAGLVECHRCPLQHMCDSACQQKAKLHHLGMGPKSLGLHLYLKLS